MIRDSVIDPTATIYQVSNIVESELQANCVVADDCDLVDVFMDEYAELGRRNHIRKSRIGRGSYTGSNTVIKNCIIGNYCSMAWNISLGGRSHDYTSASTYTSAWWKKVFAVDVPETRHDLGICTIGNDVWIGAGANIVSGVTVGDGAVIAAGAVVVKDVEPYAIVAGVPAKTIKYRFPEEVRDALSKLAWWSWDPKKIAYLAPLLNAADLDLDKIEEIRRASKQYDETLSN